MVKNGPNLCFGTTKTQVFCVFVIVFFSLLQVVPDKMSNSEFSAAAEFGSGLIPKIEYFVDCTGGQVQSSVRDNL